MICIKHVRYDIKKGDSDVPFFVPLWFVTVVTNVIIVPNVLIVIIVPNVLAVLAAPNVYTKFFFFGFSVTIGTSISSIEMPPCWKVSL